MASAPATWLDDLRAYWAALRERREAADLAQQAAVEGDALEQPAPPEAETPAAAADAQEAAQGG
jgi:hypothetical protein